MEDRRQATAHVVPEFTSRWGRAKALRRSAGRGAARVKAGGAPTSDCWPPPHTLDDSSSKSSVLEGMAVSKPAAPGDGVRPLIGSSGVMQELRRRIDRIAATEFTTLIEGESGTGKELVARQIHERSRRRTGPFVAVNCAALVETLLEAELFGIEDRTATGVKGRRGKFELGDGGTLFLDEVADLSLSAQAKLLRVIQDYTVERVGGHGPRKIDVRIIAATNRSLRELVDRKLFREDLFYRLSGVELQVPPLRTRGNDIVDLTLFFLERHRSFRQLRLSAVVLDAMMSYPWPGNVRELERLMERTVALAQGNEIGLDDFPAAIRGDYDAVLGASIARDDSMRTWGSRYARYTLERCGNKRAACRVLGITYHTLQSYLSYKTPDVTAFVHGRTVEGGRSYAPTEAGSVHETADAAGYLSPSGGKPREGRDPDIAGAS
jgi:transcriptional regulator with PAS, ATPase and Fis domain